MATEEKTTVNQATVPVTETATIPTTSAPIQSSSAFSPTKIANVYSAPNIQSIDLPSNRRAMDLKIGDLEKKLAKANSTAELNQIEIMNQPKRLGTLTGEAAYRERLDAARLNSFNNLYNARLQEEQRKEAERELFMQNYGADPKMRPSGMSMGEFSKALLAGKFSELQTPEFREARAAAARAAAAANNKEVAIGEKQSSAIINAESALSNFVQSNAGVEGYDQKVSPQLYEQERMKYVNSVPGATLADFDAQFAKRFLSDEEQQNLGINFLTPEQQAAKIAAEEEKQKAVTNANKALDKVSLLENHPALGTSVGVKGVTGGLLGGWVIPGTKAADFNSQLDALKSLLTVENLGIMKGVLSDADLKILREAATSINKNMSEADFRAELTRIKTALQNKAGLNSGDPLGLGI